ncbi:MAG: glycerol-3-phosphate 1-O-acyltransferase PlsY [Rhodobiaceae bacterium]|nr:glycerol-3-phosphate 1-O-acyltransferase PlsY [Rhodobiaceae bacterium]MCC0056994.1 glycerol-3-phosphate 1-O-acyltransferase PlsY [Rhodobiaceae bacterium]
MTAAVLLAAIFGYFLGSIPFGLLITRAAGLGDIRSIGSGNIGTTNVLRTGRKELAAATLLLDMAKATAAVLIAGQWGELAGLIAGAAAFFGHLFPLWLRFKGGKGVATYLGALLGAAPLAALAFAIIWIAVAALSRYSSLSALTASLLAPAAVYVSGAGLAATIVFALLTVALWIAHRQNIARLSAGTESRIGAK